VVSHTTVFHTRCMRVAIGLIVTCLSSALSTLGAYADNPPLASESIRASDEAYNLPLCGLCGASSTNTAPPSFESLSVCSETQGPATIGTRAEQGKCHSIPARPYPVGIELIARADGSLEVSLGRLNPPRSQDGTPGADLIDSSLLSAPRRPQSSGSPSATGSAEVLLTRQLVAILPLGRDQRFDAEFCTSTLASAVAAVSLEACAIQPGSPLCQTSPSAPLSAMPPANRAHDSTAPREDLCHRDQMRSLCARAIPREPQSTASNLAQALQRTTDQTTWGEFWYSTYIEFGSCGLVQFDPKTRRKHWAWDPSPGTAKGQCLIQEYFLSSSSFRTCVKVERNGCSLGECCEGADRGKSSDNICSGSEGTEKTGLPEVVGCVECKLPPRSTRDSGVTTATPY
jgi:hypothetical protein